MIKKIRIVSHGLVGCGKSDGIERSDTYTYSVLKYYYINHNKESVFEESYYVVLKCY